MSELGPNARALLDAARDGDEPSVADRHRVRVALGRRLAVGAAIGAVGASAVGVAHASTVAPLAGAGVAGAGGSAAGAAVGVAGTTAAIVATGGGTGAAVGAGAVGGGLAMSVGAKLVVTLALASAVGAGVATVSTRAPHAGSRVTSAPSAVIAAAPPGARTTRSAPLVGAAVAETAAPAPNDAPPPPAALPLVVDAPPFVAAAPSPAPLAPVLDAPSSTMARAPGEERAPARASSPHAASVVTGLPPHVAVAPVERAASAASAASAVPDPDALARRASDVAPPAAPAPDVRGEITLLRDAHAALARGDGAVALGLLDAHAARFPSGALVEEREAARVAALCALGRADEAHDLAGRFLREHPRSPQASHVAHACERAR